jgi:glycine cleavage system regulatory protein
MVVGSNRTGVPPNAKALDALAVRRASDHCSAGETIHFSLIGHDQPGIVDQVIAILNGLGVNAETVDIWQSAAPHSGAPLLHFEARLCFPPGLPADEVQAALEEISADIVVDIFRQTRRSVSERPHGAFDISDRPKRAAALGRLC